MTDSLSSNSLFPLSDNRASPSTVTHHQDGEEELLNVSVHNASFIEAPQKFFGKYLALNVEGRTAEEKEANCKVRKEFNEKLHEFFGAVLTEYLYPKENHGQMLEQGAPLTPRQAQEIVKKGVEMLDTLAEYCKQSLAAEAERQTQPDLLDQAMIHYAKKIKEQTLQQDGQTMGFLSHAGRVVGGSAVAGFALFTMGHLTPTDIFFLADLLSNKQISKGIEKFITAKLLEHMEYHLEAYLREQREASSPLSNAEEQHLRELLKGSLQSFSHESAYPSAKSGAIHTAALGMGLAPVNTPFDALKVIFQGETFTTGAHNQLFRDGVTAVIESIKAIQDMTSKKEASIAELVKIEKAITTAGKQVAANITEEAGAEILSDVKNQPSVSNGMASITKKTTIPPPWRRGI